MSKIRTLSNAWETFDAADGKEYRFYVSVYHSNKKVWVSVSPGSNNGAEKPDPALDAALDVMASKRSDVGEMPRYNATKAEALIEPAKAEAQGLINDFLTEYGTTRQLPVAS